MVYRGSACNHYQAGATLELLTKRYAAQIGMKGILLLGLCLAMGTPGIAKRSRLRHWPYTLCVREVPSGRFDSVFVVQLKTVKSGRLVWMRTVRYFARANWSRDHRAIAVEVGDGLLVWREGEPLHRLGKPDDYFMGCVWAPDKQHLLVRGGDSGDADIGQHGAGFLYCVKLGRAHVSDYVPVAQMVGKAGWRGNHTVRYWTYTIENGGSTLKSTPHLWHSM